MYDAPLPFVAPNKPPNRLHCAANFANQVSVAGITGLNNYQGFGSSFLNAALGNTFSGFVSAADAWNGQNGQSGADLYGMGLAGGPMLGVPLPAGAPPGLQGPLNVALAPAIGAATTTSVTTLAGETVIGDSLAFPLAAAKFAIDAATFATGYFVCQP